MTTEKSEQSENAEEVDLSISLAKANIAGLPLFLTTFALVIFIYYWLWGSVSLLTALNIFFHLGTLLPLVLSGVVVHEGMHAIGWMLAARLPMNTMKFGFSVKTLTPYAHCKVPIGASAYRIGVILPALVLGIVPAIAGIAAHNGTAMLFGALFLSSASGDMLCLWIMRRVPRDELVRDHPTRAGCLIVKPAGALRQVTVESPGTDN